MIKVASLVILTTALLFTSVKSGAFAAEKAENASAVADPTEKTSREKYIEDFVSVDAEKERHNQVPDKLKGVSVRENLGNKLTKDYIFTNHKGEKVQLKKFFNSEKPVLLSLNYYDCETLCTLQLTGIADALSELDWMPGVDFEMVTVSIDPTNTAEMASGKRQAYLDYVDREGADWNFLLSRDESQVIDLAHELGFQYSYDADTDQYAHAAVTFLITPDGVISRYLYGIDPSSRDLKFALMEASEGKLGTTLDRMILSCFHYDDLTGQYTPFAINTMRAGGLVTVGIVGVWLAALWRRDKRKRLREKFS